MSDVTPGSSGQGGQQEKRQVSSVRAGLAVEGLLIQQTLNRGTRSTQMYLKSREQTF